jgi:hypothetical protein
MDDAVSDARTTLFDQIWPEDFFESCRNSIRT